MSSSFFEIMLLVTALSIDAFAASFVYGMEKVKIPKSSVAILSLLSTSILMIFLYAGKIVSAFLPSEFTRILCFLILFLLGLIKLFDGSVKNWIKKHPSLDKKLYFSFAGLQFILTVYADPTVANGEDISVLSPMEALSLGIALSLDSAAAGLGAGMMSIHLFQTIVLCLITNTLAVCGGGCLGRKLSVKSSMDFSWLGGMILIFLSILKLL